MHRRFALMFAAPLLVSLGCQPVDEASEDHHAETATKAVETENTAPAAEATPTHAAAEGESHSCDKKGGSCTGGCDQFDEAAAEVLEREVPADAEWTVLAVNGMTCGGCERRVIANLGGLDGVLGVEADAELGRVRIAMAPNAPATVLESARAKLSELGYTAEDSAQ